MAKATRAATGRGDSDRRPYHGDYRRSRCLDVQPPLQARFFTERRLGDDSGRSRHKFDPQLVANFLLIHDALRQQLDALAGEDGAGPERSGQVPDPMTAKRQTAKNVLTRKAGAPASICRAGDIGCLPGLPAHRLYARRKSPGLSSPLRH